jgi:hypothetical protein
MSLKKIIGLSLVAGMMALSVPAFAAGAADEKKYDRAESEAEGELKHGLVSLTIGMVDNWDKKPDELTKRANVLFEKTMKDVVKWDCQPKQLAELKKYFKEHLADDLKKLADHEYDENGLTCVGGKFAGKIHFSYVRIKHDYYELRKKNAEKDKTAKK